MHVQSVPWIFQFSKKEDGINRLIYEPILQYWTNERRKKKERNVPEQRENDHRYDQHGEGRGISNLRDDPDDGQPFLTKGGENSIQDDLK